VTKIQITTNLVISLAWCLSYSGQVFFVFFVMVALCRTSVFFFFYFCHFCDTGWHCEFLQPTGSWACSLEARGLHMVFII